MSESAKNDSSAAPVSLVLEIRGKKPVLERVIFQQDGKQPETLEPQKRDTTKAIATVLTLFRACSGCASFRITSKRDGKNLVRFIVSAVREIKNNPEAKAGSKGQIYHFADGQFLNLFLAPPDSGDFNYVDLDLKRLKPASVTVTRDGSEIRDEPALKKLAAQIATSGGWELQCDYFWEAPSAPSSTAEDQKPPISDSKKESIQADARAILQQAHEYFEQGNLDEAKRTCLSLLDGARNTGGQLLLAVSQLLSVIARKEGDAVSAVLSGETALNAAGDDPECVCVAKLTLAAALFDAGRVREAFDHARTAFDIARSAKAPASVLIGALSVVLDSGSLLGEWKAIDEFTKHFRAVPVRKKEDETRRNRLLERVKGQRELRQRFETYAKDSQPLKTAATEGSMSVQAANGQVLRPLLDWWREIPEAAAELYDLWGRGNFARLLLSMKAFPHTFNVSVEVRTLDEVRSAVRLWSLVTDVLILLWKGEMRNGMGIIPFPGDYAGPGGWGYTVCAGDKLDRKPTHTRTWHPAMGWGSILPADVANFLATEAKPLLEQGRLLLVPAAATGCFHPGHGPLENLFAEICNAVPCVKGNNSPNPIGLLPYFPDVPFAALADVIGEHSKTLAKLRLLLIRHSRELRSHADPQAAMKELELEIQDALASLRDLEASLSRKNGWTKRDEPLAGSRLDFTHQQMFQAAFESEGSRPLVSLSAMLGGLERQAWSPVLVIESMGYGWRVASASATQPRKRYQPEEGEAIGAWLCPPTPGWSIPTAIRIPLR